jgi:fumarate hydratase, class I
MVIGGLSAELNLKTVKLASTKYLDGLPTSGNALGGAFRDLEWEAKILKMCQDTGKLRISISEQRQCTC